MEVLNTVRDNRISDHVKRQHLLKAPFSSDYGSLCEGNDSREGGLSHFRLFPYIFKLTLGNGKKYKKIRAETFPEEPHTYSHDTQRVLKKKFVRCLKENCDAFRAT